MKKIFTYCFLICSAASLQAQTPSQTLKRTAELKMPLTAEDDMPGTRGASVVWHPLQKKYYAAMAGNSGYPLAVFDAMGKRLSNDSLVCMEDVRGLWFDPEAKKIKGNTYSSNGWFMYKLDEDGIPLISEIIFEGQNQPTEQCVGAFSPKGKKIYFLKGSELYVYNSNTAIEEKKITLHPGRTKKQGADEDQDDEETPEAYNYSAIIYTGITGAEIGLLNKDDNQIELYSIVDGFLTRILKLPADAPTETSFNFAYTNGLYWLFSIPERIWMGFK